MLAEADAAGNERSMLSKQLTASKTAIEELERQVGLEGIYGMPQNEAGNGSAAAPMHFNCSFCLQVAELAAVVAASKAGYDDRNKRLMGLLARLQECDYEVAAATKERDQLEGLRTDNLVERKKLNNK